jgi:hypothetical protein
MPGMPFPTDHVVCAANVPHTNTIAVTSSRIRIVHLVGAV